MLVENRANTDDSNTKTFYGTKYGRSNFNDGRNRFTNNHLKRVTILRESRMNNKCFICKKPSHLPNESTLPNLLMIDIIKARIQESFGSYEAAAEVLSCFSKDEDNSLVYINANGSDWKNTTETLMNQSYCEEEAEDDLKNPSKN